MTLNKKLLNLHNKIVDIILETNTVSKSDEVNLKLQELNRVLPIITELITQLRIEQEIDDLKIGMTTDD